MKKEDALAKLFEDKRLEALSLLLNVFPDGANDDVLNLYGIELEDPKEGEIFLFDLGITEQILYSISEACKRKHEKLMGSLKNDPFCKGCREICAESLSENDKGILLKAMTYSTIGFAFKTIFQARLGSLIDTAQVPSPGEKIDESSSLVLEVRSGFRLFGAPFEHQPILAIIGDPNGIMGEDLDAPGAPDDGFEELAKKAGVKISNIVGKA